MPNIPFTGKKYLYQFKRKNKKNLGRYLTVIELTRLSAIAGAMNKEQTKRGVNRQTIGERLKQGWTAWEAVHLPIREKNLVALAI